MACRWSGLKDLKLESAVCQIGDSCTCSYAEVSLIQSLVKSYHDTTIHWLMNVHKDLDRSDTVVCIHITVCIHVYI